MKVLFVASECHPFAKTGGLGDVAYALPKALKKLGIDVRVIIPKYLNIADKYKERMTTLCNFTISVGWRDQYCGLQYLEEDGVPFYFIDNEYYFKRGGAYGYYDDGERFSYFCRAVVQSINYMDDFIPDVVHCNDWQTGMIPVLISDFKRGNHIYDNIKSVYTIHNLQYQGLFPKCVLGDLLNLGWEYYKEERVKYFDNISFMQAGINYSHAVTTVSNTYAEEIKTPYYGERLDALIRSKSDILHGIVNGIDYDIFNPETDKNIFENYNDSSVKNKENNKIELQKTLGLTVDKDIPMIGLVSRLVGQKGIDLIARVMEEIMEQNVQFVMLGTGDKEYEEMFKYYAGVYHGKLSANIFFDNSLAQKIYASSDMFLMPSKFEPCGIGQLIALRYGTIPIVRETGGLKDTVRSFNEITGEGNGFSFSNYNAHDMLYTINRALWFYNTDKKLWNDLRKNAMNEDNSWGKSASKYIDLYYSL